MTDLGDGTNGFFLWDANDTKWIKNTANELSATKKIMGENSVQNCDKWDESVFFYFHL